MICYNEPLTEISKARASLNMMRHTAQSSVRTMKILNEEHSESFTEWHLPYYILAITALELLAKIVLIKDKTGSTSLSEIDDLLRNFNHHIDVMYSERGVGRTFLECVGIDRVEKVENKDLHVYHYAIYMIDDLNQPIYAYDMESLRYGLISARKSNAAFVGYQSDKLLKLCQHVLSKEISFR